MMSDRSSVPPTSKAVASATSFPAHLFSGARLPAQVFSKPAGYFLFFEFARAFSDRAWRLFGRVARQFDETVIWFRSVDPDAKEYYEAHFGEAAEFAFATDEPVTSYVVRMHNWPSTSVADGIAYRADVVAWAGSSGTWACWGERESGLCILHIPADDRLRKELVLLSDDYVPVLSLDQALNDIASSEMTTDELATFAWAMRSSYSSSG